MPRRLLAVALAGTLALTGLTACQEQPAVAAYVNGAQLTNAQVDKALDEVLKAIPNGRVDVIRQFVVRDFVLHEVATRIAKDKGLPAPAIAPGALDTKAAAYAVPPDIAFTHYEVEADAALRAISSLAQPQAPTAEQLRSMYTQLLQAQRIPAGTPMEQLGLDTPQLRALLGLRSVVADGVKNQSISVNPRYKPLAIPVPVVLGTDALGNNVVVSLDIPLDATASPPVVDVNPSITAG
jgi:hypothetical protein